MGNSHLSLALLSVDLRPRRLVWERLIVSQMGLRRLILMLLRHVLL